jgi:hypothetical protein
MLTGLGFGMRKSVQHRLTVRIPVTGITCFLSKDRHRGWMIPDFDFALLFE